MAKTGIVLAVKGQKAKIALGPVRPYPSWEWIGEDTGRELSKYFDVSFFQGQSIPNADLIVFLKQHPKLHWFFSRKLRKAKFLYAPVDHYQSENEIFRDREFLKLSKGILIHSERLRSHLSPHHSNITYVDHHNKFGLENPPPYRDEGFILWIGGFQYVPYVLRWWESAKPKSKLVLLSDGIAGGYPARADATRLARELGIDFKFQASSVNGHALYEWSAVMQQKLMSEAKAALDIKGLESFNQKTKPPTKAQKFICSGIPFAANAESYSFEYFQTRDFPLANVEDEKYWLSKEYFEVVEKTRPAWRERLSIESVGKVWKSAIDRGLEH